MLDFAQLQFVEYLEGCSRGWIVFLLRKDLDEQQGVTAHLGPSRHT